MAEDFGFIPSQAVAPEEFGFIPNASALESLPISEQEAFKKAFIQQGTQGRLDQALSALTTPLKMGTGLADIGVKGVSGAAELAGTAAGQEGLAAKLKNLIVNVGQTGSEIVPRAAYELADVIRRSASNPAATGRALNELANPGLAVLRRLILPSAPPTPEEAQAAYENELVNQAYQKQGEEGITAFAQREVGMDPIGEANIDVARAAPLVMGAGGPLRAGISGAARVVEGLGPALRTAPETLAAAGRSASAAMKTPKDALLTSALDIQAGDIKRLATLESGGFTELVPVIQDKFVANSGAKGASKAIQEIVSDQLDKINPIVSKASPELINPLVVRTELEIKLANKGFTNEQIKGLLDHFKDRIDEARPGNIVRFTKRLGEEANALYQGAKREGLNTDTIQAAGELREIYSGIIKDILFKEGVDPVNYSATGRLMDMQNLINKNYLQSFAETQGQKGKLLREKIIPASGNLPGGPTALAARAGRGYVGKLLLNDSKILDSKINNVFNKNNRALSKTNPEVEAMAEQLKESLTKLIEEAQ